MNATIIAPNEIRTTKKYVRRISCNSVVTALGMFMTHDHAQGITINFLISQQMPHPIVMPYGKFVKEHKHLIKLLDASKNRALKAEAKSQRKELQKVIKHKY